MRRTRPRDKFLPLIQALQVVVLQVLVIQPLISFRPPSALPHWEAAPTIPTRWRWGNQEGINMVEKELGKINNLGRFSAPLPKIKWQGTVDGTRHLSTPYDYEWETAKVPRDDARLHWNNEIRKSVNLSAIAQTNEPHR